MNLFEILEKRDLDPSKEFHRLVTIFNTKEWNSLKNDELSLKDVFNESFNSCSCRSTFLTVDDLLETLGIDEKKTLLHIVECFVYVL